MKTLRGLQFLCAVVFAVVGTAGCRRADTDKPLDFSRTLRADITIRGDAPEIVLSRAMFFDGFTGRCNPAHTIGGRPMGNMLYHLIDSQSGDTLYSDGFGTLWQEWQVAELDNKPAIVFEHTLFAPMPCGCATLAIEMRGRNGGFRQLASFDISPAKVMRAAFANKPKVTTLHQSETPPDKSLDILMVSEAYTADQEERFNATARDLCDAFLGTTPYKELAANIAFRTAFAPSESGVIGDMRDSTTLTNTNIGCAYGWLESDRYLMCNHCHALADYIADIPADLVVVAVNSPVYGGGGIYNEIATLAADHAQFVDLALHEVGHSFAGLADEYYNDIDKTQNTYPLDVEPWEPNITTKVSFADKWQDLYESGEASLVEGAGYVAKGVYRPTERCMMRTLATPFCPVCRRAVERKIREFVGE